MVVWGNTQLAVVVPLLDYMPTPRVIASRYALGDAIGRGGMGTVWRADDLQLERPVAVKEVFHSDPNRLIREARAAARLSHPNAITVFDVLEEDGNAYLVMELVSAMDLAALVLRDGPLPVSQVASIGVALCDVLAAAHAQGIVHRDVKPANVMIGSDTVKLTDFGIATVADFTAITALGTVLGSPNYMSPEQAAGEDTVGPATDLWSLGATLYYAVEGIPPFARPEAIAVMTALASEPPRPPELAGPALGSVLLALLTRDPAARPSLEWVRARLAAIAAGTAAAADADAADAVFLAPKWSSDDQIGAKNPGQWAAAVFLGAVVLAVTLAAAVFVIPRHSDRPASTSAAAARPSAPPTTAVAVPAGWVPYRDPATGYTIVHPPGWQVERRSSTITDFRDPGSSTYLRVDWTDHPGPSAEAAWRALAASFAATHAGYAEIGIAPMQYKTFPAATWEFGYEQRGARLHAIDLGMVIGRYGFALNFQTDEQDWAASQPTFDAFKASFTPPA